jgi:preprotein translocase subunit SecE
MNDQVQQQTVGRGAATQITVAVLLVLAGVAGYYVMGDQSAWLRWLSVVAGCAVGGLVFMMSPAGVTFRQFAVAARNELRKVVWPTRQRTWQVTAVVFVFAAVSGVFFWLLDMFLAWATRYLTGQGG